MNCNWCHGKLRKLFKGYKYCSIVCKEKMGKAQANWYVRNRQYKRDRDKLLYKNWYWSAPESARYLKRMERLRNARGRQLKQITIEKRMLSEVYKNLPKYLNR